ncbi:MAG: NADH-quinone oxidoreductase subunit M [Planctomycetes bacterium]|nr:NADH-quinone oxidoreductase subunit M [Planctomycetota bacterium]
MIGPLAATVAAPLALALAALVPPLRPLARWFAVLGSALTLGVGAFAFADLAARPGADLRLVESHPWSTTFGASLAFGVDGLGAAMLTLSGLITLVATIAAFRESRRPHAYHALVLTLLAATNAVFTATDLLVFYVAWEALLVPMLALIGLWGGEQRRYAAIKFVVYTLAGSVAMLLLLIVIANTTAANGGATFDLPRLASMAPVWASTTVLGAPIARFGFVAVLLACLVKLPAVPLHTWLPHAHVQAPTAVSVLLAGVLLKLGVYGLYRIAWPLFPAEALAWSPALGVLGLVSILWGAFTALGQTDLKRLVAYSSVSHMGFCLFGLASGTVAGALGGAVQAVTHGFSSAALFLLVGVVYDRAHHRRVDGFGGLAGPMPRFAWLLLFASLASAGLPGLGGFVGEFLVFAGGFTANGSFPAMTAAATVSVVLAAAYLLWTVKRVAYGPLGDPQHGTFADCDRRERLAIVPLCALLLVVGVWPKPLVDALRPVCEALLTNVHGAAR